MSRQHVLHRAACRVRRCVQVLAALREVGDALGMAVRPYSVTPGAAFPSFVASMARTGGHPAANRCDSRGAGLSAWRGGCGLGWSWPSFGWTSRRGLFWPPKLAVLPPACALPRRAGGAARPSAGQRRVPAAGGAGAGAAAIQLVGAPGGVAGRARSAGRGPGSAACASAARRSGRGVPPRGSEAEGRAERLGGASGVHSCHALMGAETAWTARRAWHTAAMGLALRSSVSADASKCLACSSWPAGSGTASLRST